MTWHVTFTHLRQAQHSAARLLALYIEAQDGQTDFEDDIVTLRAYSLIGVDVSGKLFDMHRSVQLSTRKWPEMHAELQGWQEHYISILGATFPRGDYANWMTFQALFPHVEAMEMHRVTSADHRQVWARVLYNGAWYAMERGQYGMADKMARASLDVRQEVIALDDAATLDSTSIQALVLQDQGKYEQAEELDRRALAGREKALGVDHPDTLTSVRNLASVLRYQGKYKHAEEMSRQALAGREKALGVDHLDTLASVYCLTRLLDATQDHHRAFNLYQRAIVGYNRVLGPEHPTTVACQRDRASLAEKMK